MGSKSNLHISRKSCFHFIVCQLPLRFVLFSIGTSENACSWFPKIYNEIEEAMDIFGQYWHFSILGGMKIQLNIFIVSNTDFLFI